MRLSLIYLFTLLMICSLNLQHYSNAQNLLFFQGFENSSCPNSDNWSYTGGNVNTQTAYAGSHSARVGRMGESNTLTLNSANVSGYANIQLSLYYRVVNGSGPGMDSREGAVVLVRINGGAWTILERLTGFGDANWNWGSTGTVGPPSGGCTAIAMPNPVSYTAPAGTNTIEVRIVSVGLNSSSCSTFNTAMTNGTASNYDRADEGFFVDNIQITTSTSVPQMPGCEVAPVSLIEFNGQTENAIGKLYWTTASEENNSGFSIEKSHDGLLFQPIGFVKGYGNSNGIQYYRYNDLFLDGSAYYRLKQIDMNGKFSYSNIIYLNAYSKDNWLQVYPIPSYGPLTLDISLDEFSDYVIEIQDVLSRIKSKTEGKLNKGVNKLEMDLSTLESGTYFITLLTSSGKKETRAIQITR